MGETSNGHQKWKDWFFDYGVFGDEGLSLVDGYFRGQRMFNKLSLPVIRVKYLLDEQWGGITAYFGIACGPYNDKIFWIRKIFWNSQPDYRGSNNDGLIQARIYSKGLSCNLDHWHHPYWRFDFALGWPEMQRVEVYRRTSGIHIADITVEMPLINTVFFPGDPPEYCVTSTQRPGIGHRISGTGHRHSAAS